MIPKLYTLQSLIGSDFCISDDKTIKITDIVIPRIQRDYAQGRTGKAEERVRSRFLDALYAAIQNKKNITLDFIYGDVENGKLTLLDGQQRLTTLFLFYLYAAKKAHLKNNEYEFLTHFSYDTRFSSRDFCKVMVNNEIVFCSEKLSKVIKNQAWYPYDWKNDPTIQSMLVMFDAIDEKFQSIENLWKRLTENNLITFYFLPLEEMGLSDELYIKMNSRGKPLTEFEHFKAEFLDSIKEQSEELYKEFCKKIDIAWTDMLFPYRGKNQIIDDEFMRYFKFISHIICYKNDIRPIEYDEFKLSEKLYSKETVNSIDNLNYLKSAFDCWCKIDIKNFFDSYFYTDLYQKGKTKLYLRDDETTDLFCECCNKHSEFTNNGRNRMFSLNRMLLFYAVLLYQLNRDSVSEDNFRRRIRIVRNLTENSQYEIREFDQYGNNQMQRLINDIDEIMLKGNIITEDRGFNLLQKQEEKDKIEWLKNNPKYQEELFRLEDHNLLKGTTSIVSLDFPDNFSKFHMLFDNCDKDLISRALLCIGDYSQNLGWRTQFGVASKDSVWQDLFHPTKQRNENGRFKNTSKILNELLSKLPSDYSMIQNFLKKMISDFLSNTNTPKDWRYYFIKYKQMRYDTYGMYYWENKYAKPYEVIIMHTEKTLNGKNWNAFEYTLFKLYPEQFKLENFSYRGDRLSIKDTDVFIQILNDICAVTQDGTEILNIPIHGKNGIDLEDRIEKIYSEIADKYGLK